jgi:hypothetical protein
MDKLEKQTNTMDSPTKQSINTKTRPIEQTHDETTNKTNVSA